MNDELSKLISLQDLDIEIRRLRDEIASLPLRQRELEDRFTESVKESLELKKSFEDAQAERKRLESELEHEQEKHEKFKNDLMKATNEREYTTAVREIDMTRKAVGSLETEILKLMDKLEKLEVLVGERVPEIESRRVEVDRQLAEWAAAVENDQKLLDECRAKRDSMLETLGPEARSAYERLSKMRSGLALAEARDYSCQACRMKIRPQVFNDIRRGETIITCESCGRILFYRKETTTV